MVILQKQTKTSFRQTNRTFSPISFRISRGGDLSCSKWYLFCLLIFAYFGIDRKSNAVITCHISLAWNDGPWDIFARGMGRKRFFLIGGYQDWWLMICLRRKIDQSININIRRQIGSSRFDIYTHRRPTCLLLLQKVFYPGYIWAMVSIYVSTLECNKKTWRRLLKVQ